MSDIAGPHTANGKVAWIVGVGCVGAMVLIASSLSYSYWQEHGAQRHRAAPTKSAPAPKQAALPKVDAKSETGDASWYDFSGEQTANGETMDDDALTAAHPTLPFGTKVEVENVENGKTVVVRVNDRGPHVGDRIIDVSEAAAEKLGMIEDGVAEVEITPVRKAEGGAAKRAE